MDIWSFIWCNVGIQHAIGFVICSMEWANSLFSCILMESFFSRWQRSEHVFVACIKVAYNKSGEMLHRPRSLFKRSHDLINFDYASHKWRGGARCQLCGSIQNIWPTWMTSQTPVDTLHIDCNCVINVWLM